MNKLRLENINQHAPHRVMQDPVRHNNFYFVSDSGARFDIDFTKVINNNLHGFIIHCLLATSHYEKNYLLRVIFKMLLLLSISILPNLPKTLCPSSSGAF